MADGKLLWQVPFAVAGMSYNAATPIVDGQTVIYHRGRPRTKAVKIEKDGDKFAVKDVLGNKEVAPQFNTPVLKDGLLFGLSQNGMFFASTPRPARRPGATRTS